MWNQWISVCWKVQQDRRRTGLKVLQKRVSTNAILQPSSVVATSSRGVLQVRIFQWGFPVSGYFHEINLQIFQHQPWRCPATLGTSLEISVIYSSFWFQRGETRTEFKTLLPFVRIVVYIHRKTTKQGKHNLRMCWFGFVFLFIWDSSMVLFVPKCGYCQPQSNERPVQLEFTPWKTSFSPIFFPSAELHYFGLHKYRRKTLTKKKRLWNHFVLFQMRILCPSGCQGGRCGVLRLENQVITLADFLKGCFTENWIFHGS